MSDAILGNIITGLFAMSGIYLTARLAREKRQGREDRDLSDQLRTSQDRIIAMQDAEIRRLGGTPVTTGPLEVKR